MSIDRELITNLVHMPKSTLISIVRMLLFGLFYVVVKLTSLWLFEDINLGLGKV